ncbi:hypothetical protein [Limnoglobus roseus]|uniref:Uncharacterized protein n=1 Tax=Limnoglobus roseus TaxID=2598579 RepID=A0A5C1ALI5_9BACT|nr:hypothetical protein [Limnoglobus roseus]QEL19810.1 hypothetical protein PX52LOC_06890 [Limnoglobus roseus]
MFSSFFAPLFSPARPSPSRPLRGRLAAAVADLGELSTQGHAFADDEIDRDAVALTVRLAVRLLRLGRVLPSEDTQLATRPLPLWDRLIDAAGVLEALLRDGPFADAEGFDADAVAAVEALGDDLWKKLEDHYASVPTPDSDDGEEAHHLASADFDADRDRDEDAEGEGEGGDRPIGYLGFLDPAGPRS